VPGIATSVAVCYAVAMIDLGERIAGLRMEAGMSRSELARRAAVSAEGIRKLENGESRHPSNNVLARVAAVFGLTVDELTGDQAPALPYEPLDPDIAAIVVNLKATKKLDPQALDRLAETILAVKEKTEREAQG
jgi:transcriptional regulator with XRE-family HTH domain